MKAFFRRLSGAERLPLGSSELASALRAAARLSESPDAAIEYTAAADALDRAITHTRRKGDGPTRDELAYALGRAQLGLRDQLTELIEIVKGDRVDFQDLGGSIADLKAAMGEMFSSLGESLNERLTDLELRIATVEGTVAQHDASRAASIAERAELRRDMAESQAHRRRIQETLDTELPEIREELAEIRATLDRLVPPDAIQAVATAQAEQAARIAALERGAEPPEADGG